MTELTEAERRKFYEAFVDCVTFDGDDILDVKFGPMLLAATAIIDARLAPIRALAKDWQEV